MALSFAGNGTIAGLSVGGLPDGTVDGDTLASGVGGKVLQVVSTEKTDTFTTTSTSWVDVTGYSVAITPSATSSKVYISCSYGIGSTGNTYATHIRLLRGATAISVGDLDGVREQASGSHIGFATTAISMGIINFLDSPATTSATTYKLQMRVQGTTGTFNRTGHDGSQSGSPYPRTSSSFTATEIGV